MKKAPDVYAMSPVQLKRFLARQAAKSDEPEDWEWAEPDEEDLEPEDDFGLSNEDLGLCPHGCRDDDGCEEPGCRGGPDWDEGDDDYDD